MVFKKRKKCIKNSIHIYSLIKVLDKKAVYKKGNTPLKEYGVEHYLEL